MNEQENDDLKLGEVKENSLVAAAEWLIDLKDSLESEIENKKWYKKLSLRGSATKKLYNYLDKDKFFQDSNNLMSMLKDAKDNYKKSEDEQSEKIVAGLPVFKGMVAERMKSILSCIWKIVQSAPSSSYLKSEEFTEKLEEVTKIVEDKIKLYTQRQKKFIEALNKSEKNKALAEFSKAKKSMNKSVKEMMKASEAAEENIEENITKNNEGDE